MRAHVESLLRDGRPYAYEGRGAANWSEAWSSGEDVLALIIRAI